MAKDKDIRIERTRAFLIDALVELMEEKDATSISVAELTRRAQVNRSTFYLHYEDIFDFLDKESRRMVDGLIEEVRGDKTADGASEFHYTAFFAYVEKNKGFFEKMLGPHGYYGFREYMELEGRKAYGEMIGAETFGKADVLDADMIAMYLVSAHMGLIKLWLDRGMIYSPSAMSRMVDRLTVRGVLASVGLSDKHWIPK